MRRACPQWLLLAACTAGCGTFPGKNHADGIRGSDNGGRVKLPVALLPAVDDLSGTLVERGGGALPGWVVASFEFDSGVARVGEVDSAGRYVLAHVRTGQPQTLALLTPDYVLHGVVSVPPADGAPGTIRQFFRPGSSALPELTSDGCIMTFADWRGLDVLPFQTSAQKGDGTPDGCAKITGQAGPAAPQPATSGRGPTLRPFAARAAPPKSAHGLDPRHDPDINGDGIVNWLDGDDNGNGIPDVFDPDQNGDLVSDLTPEGHDTDQWFDQGVEFIAVSYELTPKADGSGLQRVLRLATKVRDDAAQPTRVQIRGAPSLLNGAMYLASADDGGSVPVAWDRTLADDGRSDDGAAGDGIYGRKVVLADGKAPQANQVLFFDLVFGDPRAPWSLSFPFTFPAVDVSAVGAQYDSGSGQVLLVGRPFGDVQDFVWLVSLFDAGGRLVWGSAAAPGSTRQAALPAAALAAAGTGATFSVSASSLDKVPGRPVLKVTSPRYQLR